MTIQTDDMAAFLAVVREGSFGRAASSLLVSQPAISDRMARLEREVGTSLFHRSTRGAALTPAGDAFLPYAERTVDLLEDAAATLQALRRGTSSARRGPRHLRAPRRAARVALARHPPAQRQGTRRPLGHDHRRAAGRWMRRGLRRARSAASSAALRGAATRSGRCRRRTIAPIGWAERRGARPRGSPGGVQPVRHRRRRVRAAPAKGGRARMELDGVLRRRDRSPSGRPRRPRGHGDQVPGRRACRTRHRPST